jgi:hypothetical protein
MRKPGFSLVIACLLATGSVAAPARAVDSCYQKSNLSFFEHVVELVAWERNSQLDCWLLRFRLRGGPTSPEGHAMICKGNACSPDLDLREGISWWAASSANLNIRSVSRMENGSCTDVTFCVTPNAPTETMLVDFVAFFEEGYYLPPSTWKPRWSHGLIDLSAIEGNKSHCQDDDPPPLRLQGAVCL